ncbi:MAG: PEGA domain-containing protein [Methanoregula sp.]|nr:PEGA domain-containing protein [Methanoregula sp.]
MAISASPFTLVLILIALAIVSAGCTGAPVAEPQASGTVRASSVPTGSEVYLDGEYRGTSPVIIADIPAGHHTLEFRKGGYESVTYPVTVTGGMEDIRVTLASTNYTLPVTVATTTTPSYDLPQVHVDGYWTWPAAGRSTENPVPLLVHTEAFNVGPGDAREVTVSANFYYDGRMICWNTVYLGTLAAGGHVSRDNQFSCTLPSSMSDQNLEVRFDNVVVTQ